MPKFVINNEFVPVSVYFIENCLKDASGIFLKVYLYALNLAVKGLEFENSDIAEDLGILESDVMQAFVYWKKSGMILEDSGVIEFCSKPITEYTSAEKIPAVTPPPSNIPSVPQKKSYDSIEVAKIISDNQNLSELVLLAQELFGKPLTTPELETIYWFYDTLGFSTEAILLILDYCISRDKKSMRYIEKVALSWHEKGIITAEQIVEYISEEEKKNGIVYHIKKAMGINDRNLSKAEEQYITKWNTTYMFDEDMILLAYEYCLLNTTKLSFPYIDKIMERWFKQGIKTKEDAENDNKRHKSQNNSFNPYDDNFNHTDLEKITRNNEND